MIRFVRTSAHWYSLVCYLVLLCFVASPSLGQSIHLVTTVNDEGAGSLRQALLDANANDIIEFDDAIHGQTIELTSGPILIEKDLLIQGPGSDLVTVQAMGAFRVVELRTSLTAELSGVKITGGNATGNGGGLLVEEEASLTVRDVEFTGNLATDNGGGVFISSGANVLISDSKITGNRASGDLSPNGGGIYNASGTVFLNNTLISENESTRGGGIWNTSNATMLLETSWVVGNKASLEGGGIYNNSKLTLRRSTVSGNEAELEAGGIRNRSGDTLKVINSTISGNTAASTGGIVNFMGSTTLVYNSTIYGNTSDTPGAGIWNTENATVKLYSTIVAANIRDGNVHSDILDDGAGVVSEGFNWIGARTTFQALPTDKVGTPDSPISPRLLPLVENDLGGPTHAPDENSLIIDQGDCQRLPMDVDQRGIPRIIDVAGLTNAGDGCDIGAVEFDVVNVSIDDELNDLPRSLSITAAYPNPFSSSSMFSIVVPNNEYVEITLYNILGKQMDVLHAGPLQSRIVHSFKIDGSFLPAGLYFYKIQGESFAESRSIVVLR